MAKRNTIWEDIVFILSFCKDNSYPLLDFLPNNVFIIILPILRSRPAFEVGMPVSLAIFCFICEMPNARFSEKLRPGIGVVFLLMIKKLLLLHYFLLSENSHLFATEEHTLVCHCKFPVDYLSKKFRLSRNHLSLHLS